MPLSVVHRLDDGTTLEHRAVHNVYGMQNARATYDGLRKLQPDERPFVLTRAAYAGTQRFAATWTGDNSATWNHLSMSTPVLLSMSVSGYPMVGDDIGGFASSPPADLLTRWYEVGAFNPIYRNHAAKDTAPHEPWANGPEQEAIRRKYIELRYKLLPYIYTITEEETRTGVPLMRPVFLEYPRAEEFQGDDRDFFFGPDFFVAPVVSETTDPQKVTLPSGEWYDFWTSERHINKEPIALHPKLDEVPLYVRAGGIVPMQPLVQYTGQTPVGPLELRVYLPSKTGPGDCRGALYEDDGHTFAYKRGEILRMGYGCEVSADRVTVTSTVNVNRFRPWWNSAVLEIYGLTTAPKEVRLDAEALKDWRYDSQTHSLTVVLPNAARKWTVQAVF